MSYECDYESLYAQYLGTEEELLDMVGTLTGKLVWDLCCGNGKMTVLASQRGAKQVVAIDASCTMLTPLIEKKIPNVAIVCQSIEDHLIVPPSPRHIPDVVLCRQGINYWLNPQTAKHLAERMKKGSILVFNTFRNLPSVVPTVKQYQHLGKEYVEVSWLVGDMVHHVQVREGLPCHTTEFKWISPEEFRMLLEPNFMVSERIRDRTGLWCCVRK